VTIAERTPPSGPTLLSTDAQPFTLGTAQLGMPYGLTRPSAAGSAAGVAAILGAARDGGIVWLDTARAYGQSEERIGRWMAAEGASFRIVSKLPSLEAIAESEAAAAVTAALDQTLTSLGVASIDVYLAHRSADLLRAPVAAALREAREQGRISLFGASVYEPDEMAQVMRVEGLGAVQIPFSVFNRAFHDAGLIAAAAERGILVFARSVFLQGALLMAPRDLPPFLLGLAKPIERLRLLAAEAKITLPQLLIASVKQVPGIFSPVLGVDSASQLCELAQAIDGEVSHELLETATRVGRDVSRALSDPRRWPKTPPASR